MIPTIAAATAQQVVINQNGFNSAGGEAMALVNGEAGGLGQMQVAALQNQLFSSTLNQLMTEELVASGESLAELNEEVKEDSSNLAQEIPVHYGIMINPGLVNQVSNNTNVIQENTNYDEMVQDVINKNANPSANDGDLPNFKEDEPEVYFNNQNSGGQKNTYQKQQNTEIGADENYTDETNTSALNLKQQTHNKLSNNQPQPVTLYKEDANSKLINYEQFEQAVNQATNNQNIQNDANLLNNDGSTKEDQALIAESNPEYFQNDTTYYEAQAPENKPEVILNAHSNLEVYLKKDNENNAENAETTESVAGVSTSENSNSKPITNAIKQMKSDAVKSDKKPDSLPIENAKEDLRAKEPDEASKEFSAHMREAYGSDGINKTKESDRLSQVNELASYNNKAEIASPVDQIKFNVIKGVENKTNKIIVQLEPHELGKVEIVLDVNPDSSVFVKIAADKSETLELLQKDFKHLERTLSESGIKIASDNISFSLNTNANQNNGSSDREFMENRQEALKNYSDNLASDEQNIIRRSYGSSNHLIDILA